jgi:hypothetical protein
MRNHSLPACVVVFLTMHQSGLVTLFQYGILYSMLLQIVAGQEHILMHCHQYIMHSNKGPMLGTSLVTVLKETPTAFALSKPDQGVG